MSFRSIILYTFLLFSIATNAQEKTCLIKGKITNQFGKVSDLVAVKLNQVTKTFTNKFGEFEFKLLKNQTYLISTYHLSFESYVTQISTNISNDTLLVFFKLKERTNLLESVDVYAMNKPETLVGKPNYGIYDFDFFEDKLILLTAKNNLKAAEVKLTDYSGKEYMSHPIPKDAGIALKFFHDYMGYTNLLCEDSIFRIEVINNFFLITGLSKDEFNTQLKPVNDTVNGHLYFNNQDPDYPLFNYFYVDKNNTKLHKLLCTVINKELMDSYNWEYYFLPSRFQLETWKFRCNSPHLTA